jgi:hypothetical protein
MTIRTRIALITYMFMLMPPRVPRRAIQTVGPRVAVRLTPQERGTRAWTKRAFLGLYGRVTKAAGTCYGPQHLKSLCFYPPSCAPLPSLNVLAFRLTIPGAISSRRGRPYRCRVCGGQAQLCQVGRPVGRV